MLTRPTLMTPGRVIIRLLTILLLSFFLVTPFNRAAQPSESSKTPTLEDAKPHNMPWGSYSNHVTDEGLKNPFITGVMLTVSWGQIQPDSEKDFKWSKVDEELNKAKAAGKDVTLVLHSGGRHTPGWVKHTPGIQLISIVDTNIYNKKSYCQPVTVPVFWDPIFLEKKKKYIAEAGKRYGTNPNISGVIVSFANFMTDDWNVPHRADDSGGECGKKFDQIRQWKDAGYTTEKMFNAGKETIDAWAAAFPGKALKLPLHLTHKGLEDDKDGTPPTGSKLAVKITQYGYERYPDRFYVQINWLSAKTPQATDPKVSGADPDSHLYILRLLTGHPHRIGLQMLAAASNGKKDNCRQNGKERPCDPHRVLLDAVKAGLSYKPRYLEYWREDVENKDLQDILQLANAGME